MENGGRKDSREYRASGTPPRALAFVFLRLVARLPLRLAHALGVVIGWALYGSPTYRRHLRANLAQAGYEGNARVRSAAIGEAGKMVAEMPKIFFGPRPRTLELVRTFAGREHIAAALAARKGLVLLAPHFGSFEIAARALAGLCPLTALYRPAKMAWLGEILEHGRRWPNVRTVPANLGGVRSLLAALKRGEAILVLPDQVPSEGEGAWVEFFGRTAYTMTLAGRFAERTGSVCLLLTGERLPHGAGFALRARPLGKAVPGETPERRVNRAIEEAIRERPEQYLWGYNRYKRPRGAPHAPAA